MSRHAGRTCATQRERQQRTGAKRGRRRARVTKREAASG